MPLQKLNKITLYFLGSLFLLVSSYIINSTDKAEGSLKANLMTSTSDILLPSAYADVPSDGGSDSGGDCGDGGDGDCGG